MKTVRKTSDKLKASLSSRVPIAKKAKAKVAVAKTATRQKADVAAAIGTARTISKKKATVERDAKAPTRKAVRDNFKMPASDYALIEALKQRALEFNRPTKKNELLRAGLHALGSLDNTQLQQRLLALGPTGQKEANAETSKSSKVKV